MENKLHILLCEDEESLGMLVREYLQAKGYDAELYLDGEAGYKAFVKGEYDMCLLDVMMPKMDGFTLARELRMINSEVPIMFLTAKNLKDDILEGFKLGADDYLTKPFSMDELVYRMEAILRRVKARNKQMAVRYQLGRFVFDTQRQLLTIGDKSTKLTTKESELLQRTQHGRVYHQAAQASEGRSQRGDQQRARQGLPPGGSLQLMFVSPSILMAEGGSHAASCHEPF